MWAAFGGQVLNTLCKKKKVLFICYILNLPSSPLWPPDNFWNPPNYPGCCVEEPSLGHQTEALKREEYGRNIASRMLNRTLTKHLFLATGNLSTGYCTVCYCPRGQRNTTNLCSPEVESQGPGSLDEPLAQHFWLHQLAVSYAYSPWAPFSDGPWVALVCESSIINT